MKEQAIKVLKRLLTLEPPSEVAEEAKVELNQLGLAVPEK